MFNPLFNVLKSMKKDKKPKGFKSPPSIPKTALPLAKKLPKENK